MVEGGRSCGGFEERRRRCAVLIDGYRVESEKEGERNRVSLSLVYCTLFSARTTTATRSAASSRSSSRNRTAARNCTGAAAAATATRVAEKKATFFQITPSYYYLICRFLRVQKLRRKRRRKRD